MYILVFSIIARSWGLSLAQHTDQTSFLSILPEVKLSEALLVSSFKSIVVNSPVESTTAARVELQLIDILQARLENE
jgi:hypothetical protein